ncbi:hypothetical protein CN084_25040 [Sinorhizobium medicae]|nr:hypothetical protein CN084_25040 [Sinorhizobium medicae]
MHSGADPEGVFPVVLGHEGEGVLVEVGAPTAIPNRHISDLTQSTWPDPLVNSVGLTLTE